MSLVSRAQRSTKWCAADPGSLRTLSLQRSRISCASLRAAPRPGNSSHRNRLKFGRKAVHALGAGRGDLHGLGEDAAGLAGAPGRIVEIDVEGEHHAGAEFVADDL